MVVFGRCCEGSKLHQRVEKGDEFRGMKRNLVVENRLKNVSLPRLVPLIPQVEKLKKSGNDAMKNCQYDLAVKLYSDAIALDPENHVLYSNRSAAYTKKESYEAALKDAELTIQWKRDWPKVTPVC